MPQQTLEQMSLFSVDNDQNSNTQDASPSSSFDTFIDNSSPSLSSSASSSASSLTDIDYFKEKQKEFDDMKSELDDLLNEAVNNFNNPNSSSYNDSSVLAEIQAEHDECLEEIKVQERNLKDEMVKVATQMDNLIDDWYNKQYALWHDRYCQYKAEFDKWNAKYLGCLIYPVEAIDEVNNIRARYYYFINLLGPDKLRLVLQTHIKISKDKLAKFEAESTFDLSMKDRCDYMKKALESFFMDDYRDLITDKDPNLASSNASAVDGAYPNPITETSDKQIHRG